MLKIRFLFFLSPVLFFMISTNQLYSQIPQPYNDRHIAKQTQAHHQSTYLVSAYHRTKTIGYTTLQSQPVTPVDIAQSKQTKTFSGATYFYTSTDSPFYYNLWFLTSILILVVGLSYIVHRWRLRNIRARTNVLESAIEEKETSLEHVHNFLEIAIDFLPIGLLVVNPERFIVKANRAAEELFEMKEDDLNGEEIHNLLSSPILTRDAVWQRLHKKRTKLELIGHDQKGKRFICQVHSDYSEDKEGKLRYLIMTCENIDHRKQMEARVIESEKQLALADLLAGIGDVLNERISGIQGYMDMLKEEFGQTGHMDPAKIISWVQDSVQDISKILTQLIECSTYLVKVPVVLMDLQTVLNDLRRRWDNKLKITLPELSEKIPIKVVSKFRNGLDEAVLNALEAGATSMTIEVEILTMISRIRIVMTDDGKGVSPENINRVFMPFFNTKGSPHSGLGLWKLYQAIKQCGGTAEMVALKEGSSQLRIILPIAPGEPLQMTTSKSSINKRASQHLDSDSSS